MRILLLAATALVLVGFTDATTRVPAIKYQDGKFGLILVTQAKNALYTWNVEKRAHGKIRCVGACAVAWPPLLAKGTVPKHVAGISGAFGTIRRPGGKRQVTFNGLAVYTYAHEGPKQVLCDNVDGWFVVRIR
ncbi:MAG: hypothetical protein ABI948_10575 [Thermoleophilia bacterium]